MRNINYFFLPTCILLLAAFLLYHHIFLHSDVSYLMYVTDLLLSGKTYGRDFYETNPPMILYIYLPVVLLAKKVTFLSQENILRLYVFTLIMISTYLSYYLLKNIGTFAKKRSIFLYYSILIILLFVSSYQFGQREHLFVIFLLPYLFSASARLEQKKINLLLAIGIGIFSGIGFCIKPFFLFPLILIETYLIYRSGSLFSWLRPETLTILLLLVIYLASTLAFYPNYFTEVLPLINQFYFYGMSQPWRWIFVSPMVVFCFAALLSALVVSRYHSPSALNMTLSLGLTGVVLSFLVTKTAWPSHTCAAVSLACLYLAYCFSEWIDYSLTKSIFFLAAGLFVFYLPLLEIYQTFNMRIQETAQGDRIQLINYLAHLPGPHSITCFSGSTTADCFPLQSKTQSLYGNRYPFFWWLNGIIKRANHPDKNFLAGENYLISSVAEDLNEWQPRWVILNSQDQAIIYGNHFDLINFFSANIHFRRAWQHYHYLTTIGIYHIYERTKN